MEMVAIDSDGFRERTVGRVRHRRVRQDADPMVHLDVIERTAASSHAIGARITVGEHMMRNTVNRRSRSWDRDGPTASKQVPVLDNTRVPRSDHSIVVLERKRRMILTKQNGVKHAARNDRNLLLGGLLCVARHVERLVDDARLTEEPRWLEDAHGYAWAE